MKSVQELNREELEELRFTYFYNENINHFYRNVDDIPNEVLFEHYGGINFVEEDFSCNL
jgi:hypothetical protein